MVTTQECIIMVLHLDMGQILCMATGIFPMQILAIYTNKYTSNWKRGNLWCELFL
jgi:hypothetical protein